MKIWRTFTDEGGKYPNNFYDSVAYSNIANWVQVPYGTTGTYNLNNGSILVENCYYMYWDNFDYPTQQSEGPRWLPKVILRNGTTVYGLPLEQYQSSYYGGIYYRGWTRDSITINENTASKVNITWKKGYMELHNEFYADSPIRRIEPVGPATNWWIGLHYNAYYALFPQDDGAGNDWVHHRQDYPLTNGTYHFHPDVESGYTVGKFQMFQTWENSPTTWAPYNVSSILTYDDEDFANPQVNLVFSSYTRFAEILGYIPNPGNNKYAYTADLNTEDSFWAEAPNVARTAGQWYNSSFSAPFSARWRMTVAVGYTDDPNDKNRHNWYSTDIYGSSGFDFQVPITGTVYHVMIYPYDRTEDTPSAKLTLMDIYNYIWNPSNLTGDEQNPTIWNNRLKTDKYSANKSVLNHNTYLDVGNISSTAAKYRFIIHPRDLTGFSSSNIDSARLGLWWYYQETNRSSPTTLYLMRAGQHYTNGTSYLNKSNNTAWNNTGGDWFDTDGVAQGTTPFATITIPATAPTNEYYYFEGSAFSQLVKDFADEVYPDYGFFIYSPNETEANSYVAFSALDSPNTTQIPVLDITLKSSAIFNTEGDFNNGTYSGTKVQRCSGKLTLQEAVSDYSTRYDFCEGSGTFLADENATSANTGTLVGTASWSENGVLIDANGEAIQTNSSALNDSDTGTIIMTFKATSGWATFAKFVDITDSTFQFYRTATTGSYNFQVGSDNTFYINGTNLHDGATRTIALNWSTNFKGVNYNNTVHATSTTSYTYPSMDSIMYMGNRPSDGLRQIGGIILQFAYFQRLLNQSETGDVITGKKKTEGNYTISYNAGVDKVVNGIVINATTASGTNYSVAYKNGVGGYTSLGTALTGNQSLTISGDKYQNTTFLFTLYGNSTERPYIDQFELLTEQLYAPYIADWGNNITNNTSLNIIGNTSIAIKFNATANQTVDTWTWKVNGSDQNNNYDNLTVLFGLIGNHTVAVQANNGVGSGNTITWNVNITGTKYYPPAPVNIASTVGTSWINTTWEPGAGGNITDGYGVSYTIFDDAWNEISSDYIAVSPNNYLNVTLLSRNDRVNVTVSSYNHSGVYNDTELSLSSQVPETFARNVSQSFAVSGTAARTGYLNRTNPITLTITHAGIRTGVFNREQVLQPVSISEIIRRSGVFGRESIQLISVLDAYDIRRIWQRYALQTISVSSYTERIRAVARVIEQTVTVPALSADRNTNIIRKISQSIQTIPNLTAGFLQALITCNGYCYIGMDEAPGRTLKEIDSLQTNDRVQGWYNTSTQKYESHSTGYLLNENVSVPQKWGYYYYFISPTNIVVKIPVGTIALKPGWNLVANFNESGRTLLQLKTSIGSNVTLVNYYNRTSKSWGAADSTVVPAGEAFFVNVNANTEWSG